MNSSFFSVLQRVGQSLMVPVSVLPAAGLLVAVGRLFSEDSTAFKLLVSGGLSVFEQLSLLFAIGVAIGFTNGAGIAGLAAAVGYFLLKSLLKVFGELQGLDAPIDTGVFGGILVGLLVSWTYKNFSNVKLPQVLGFFAGKRLVPIMTAVFTVGLALILAYGWPPIQGGIRAFGHWVMGSEFGPAFYAAGKRLLIPVGLHHVYYPSFLFEFGEFIKASGEVVRGEAARYYAGDPTAGRFMASEFPIMLFGLPAAALAIVLRARKEQRKLVGGVMLSAALTSILTGITEPIEFAFIFVAPVLFVMHVGFAFMSGFLTQLFDIHLGYTFSASLIDFAAGFFNQKNSMMFWLIVGPSMAATYFFSFYGVIGLLNLKTPGREDSSSESLDPVGLTIAGQRPQEILAALGGSQNIAHLDACITRLRVTVKNPDQVSDNKLKSLGAAGVMRAGSNLQVVFGTESDQIKEQIKLLLAEAKKVLALLAPLKGSVIPLDQVPDDTFAQKILGEGVAIKPTEGLVRSPVAGTVANMFRTGHAVGIISDEGAELLIHVGIDTVKLNGEGFKPLVKSGDRVSVGQALIEFDLKLIQQKAKSDITPVVVTNMDQFNSITPIAKSTVEFKDNLLTLTLK